MMRSPRWLLGLGLVSAVFATTAAPASAKPPTPSEETPSGERIVGKTVIEPVYDDMTGAIRYVSTPMKTPDPVRSNPIAAAPFYLPVYPAGSNPGTLLCKDVPVENCPDHGPLVAGAAEEIMPSVYEGGVIGHDHLMAGPASHGDFNVAWVPTLILFTSSEAAETHITLLSEIEEMLEAGEIIEIPLNGENGTPNLTFHCAVISGSVYLRGTPFEEEVI
jgi:hypothetical protein